MSVQDHHEETPVLPEPGGTLPRFSDEIPSQQTADYPLSFESNRAYDTHPVESSRNKRTTAVLVGAGTLLAAGTALGIGYLLGNKGEDEVTASPKPTASQPSIEPESPVTQAPSTSTESFSPTPESSPPSVDSLIGPTKKMPEGYKYFDRHSADEIKQRIDDSITDPVENQLLFQLATEAFYPVLPAEDYNPDRFKEKGIPAGDSSYEGVPDAYITDPVNAVVAGQIANDWFGALNLKSLTNMSEMLGTDVLSNSQETLDGFNDPSLSNVFWIARLPSLGEVEVDSDLGTDSTTYTFSISGQGVRKNDTPERIAEALTPEEYDSYIAGNTFLTFEFVAVVDNSNHKLQSIKARF